MPDTRYLRQTQWTDVCLAVGPNLRWAEDGYEDLAAAYPEVFLGVRVRILTSERLHLEVAGSYPSKIVVFNGPHSPRGVQQLDYVCGVARFYSMPTKIEFWHVHRGRGIWRNA